MEAATALLVPLGLESLKGDKYLSFNKWIGQKKFRITASVNTDLIVIYFCYINHEL